MHDVRILIATNHDLMLLIVWGLRHAMAQQGDTWASNELFNQCQTLNFMLFLANLVASMVGVCDSLPSPRLQLPLSWTPHASFPYIEIQTLHNSIRWFDINNLPPTYQQGPLDKLESHSTIEGYIPNSHIVQCMTVLAVILVMDSNKWWGILHSKSSITIDMIGV